MKFVQAWIEYLVVFMLCTFIYMITTKMTNRDTYTPPPPTEIPFDYRGHRMVPTARPGKRRDGKVSRNLQVRLYLSVDSYKILKRFPYISGDHDEWCAACAAAREYVDEIQKEKRIQKI